MFSEDSGFSLETVNSARNNHFGPILGGFLRSTPPNEVRIFTKILPVNAMQGNA